MISCIIYSYTHAHTICLFVYFIFLFGAEFRAILIIFFFLTKMRKVYMADETFLNFICNHRCSTQSISISIHNHIYFAGETFTFVFIIVIIVIYPWHCNISVVWCFWCCCWTREKEIRKPFVYWNDAIRRWEIHFTFDCEWCEHNHGCVSSTCMLPCFACSLTHSRIQMNEWVHFELEQ